MDRLANAEGQQAGQESTDSQESPHPAEPLLACSPAGPGFPLQFLPRDWEYRGHRYVRSHKADL